MGDRKRSYWSPFGVFVLTMVAGAIVVAGAVYALVALAPIDFTGEGSPQGHDYWR